MLGMCKWPLQGEKYTRGSWFGPLGGSVLPSLVPLVSKQRGRRRLCAHPTDRGNQCTQVGHMGAVGSAFAVHPKRFSLEFGEGAFALSAELYICQQFSQYVATFNQRVSRGTCSAGAVGCGLLRTEHVKNKTQQSDRGLKHLCVQKRRDEARRRPSSWIEEFRALFLVETPFYLVSLFFPSPQHLLLSGISCTS